MDALFRGNDMSLRANYHRKSNRLSGYDYSQPGAYFITIKSFLRKSIFGKINKGVFVPTPAGKIVEQEWFRSEQIRDEDELARIRRNVRENPLLWEGGK
jgi:hypothetical protein